MSSTICGDLSVYLAIFFETPQTLSQYLYRPVAIAYTFRAGLQPQLCTIPGDLYRYLPCTEYCGDRQPCLVIFIETSNPGLHSLWRPLILSDNVQASSQVYMYRCPHLHEFVCCLIRIFCPIIGTYFCSTILHFYTDIRDCSESKR